MVHELAACCSTICEKGLTCKRRYVSGYCKDYYSFGSCSFSDNNAPIENHWCGPHGNYNMYIPIDKSMIIDQFNIVIKMSEEIGCPIKLYPESENPLKIYYNTDRDMLLVDKYLCR
jgi:hypothetical protein